MTRRLKIIFGACAAVTLGAVAVSGLYQHAEPDKNVELEGMSLAQFEAALNESICRGGKEKAKISYKKYTPPSLEQQMERLKSEYPLFFSDLSGEEILAELKKQKPDILKHDEKRGLIWARWLDDDKKVHRDSAPAWIDYNYKTGELVIRYAQHGKADRDEKEAYIKLTKNKLILSSNKDGKVHRGENLPANITYRLKEGKIYLDWGIDGGINRTDDGPNKAIVDMTSYTPIFQEWARRPANYKGARVLHRSDGLHALHRDPKTGVFFRETWMQHKDHSHSDERLCDIRRDRQSGRLKSAIETFNGQKVKTEEQKLCPSALQYKH
ncbi:MAG: hypothetical protein MRY79_08585 [Alphaproteobacteria bacterium]|nr:hypothetical protein [Alphaproteobacteria bacterium]